VLQREQILVEFDLFQEALWSRVVVTPVVLEVHGTDVIDRHVHLGHELGHRNSHLRLQQTMYHIYEVQWSTCSESQLKHV